MNLKGCSGYIMTHACMTKINRFAAIIRFVWDISMIVLEIVYEGFCEKVILGITKVMTFRVSSTEIRAKNGSKYCVNKQQ